MRTPNLDSPYQCSFDSLLFVKPNVTAHAVLGGSPFMEELFVLNPTTSPAIAACQSREPVLDFHGVRAGFTVRFTCTSPGMTLGAFSNNVITPIVRYGSKNESGLCNSTTIDVHCRGRQDLHVHRRERQDHVMAGWVVPVSPDLNLTVGTSQTVSFVCSKCT